MTDKLSAMKKEIEGLLELEKKAAERPWSGKIGHMNKANSDLICALRNQSPKLLRVLLKALNVVNAAREAHETAQVLGHCSNAGTIEALQAFDEEVGK